MKRIINGVAEETPSLEMVELPHDGTGVFETLLLREGTPVFFEDHWARFARGCQWYGFAAPTTAETMAGIARHLSVENKVATGVLRFAAWKHTDKVVEWRVEVSPPRPHMTRSSVRITVGPSLPAADQDRAFKHLNRGAWLQALRAVRASGWDDALLLDSMGYVVETCVSNGFFVDQHGLHTPALETGALPGVMRGRVIALAKELGLNVKEGHYRLSDLQQASEIWLSNSLLGLRPVTECADRSFSAPFPVLQRFRAGWEARHGWDPVVVVPTL